MVQRHLDPSYQRARGWPNGAVEEAEAGDVEAQLYLAEAHSSDEAIRWYTMAGNQGNARAMCALSNMHVELDLVQACFWMKQFFQLVGTQVDQPMVVNTMWSYGWILIGTVPITNRAVPPLPKEMIDIEEGLRLLERAGEFGGMEAISELAHLFSGRKHLPVDFNSEKAVEKAVYWTKKGALLGNGQHALELSNIYYCVGLVNPVLAKKWLEVAVKLGHEDAREWMARDALGSGTPMSSDEICKRLDDEHEEKLFEPYTMVDKSTKCSKPDCNNEDGARRFAVCKRCKQVKYCSKECQDAHFFAENGHKTACKHLRRQKDELKRRSRNRLLALVECFNPDCDRRQEGDQKFGHCSKCNNAKYCSRSCQRLHWETGHRGACQRIVNELQEVNALLEQLNSS